VCPITLNILSYSIVRPASIGIKGGIAACHVIRKVSMMTINTVLVSNLFVNVKKRKRKTSVIVDVAVTSVKLARLNVYAKKQINDGHWSSSIYEGLFYMKRRVHRV